MQTLNQNQATLINEIVLLTTTVQITLFKPSGEYYETSSVTLYADWIIKTNTEPQIYLETLREQIKDMIIAMDIPQGYVVHVSHDCLVPFIILLNHIDNV